MSEDWVAYVETSLALRNGFLQCVTIRDAAGLAVERLRALGHVVLAAVYLLEKDGLLRRSVNREKRGAEGDAFEFLPSSIRPGSGFIGKAVAPAASDTYARPRFWQARSGENTPHELSPAGPEANAFNWAAAVPLNGKHRSFGV